MKKIATLAALVAALSLAACSDSDRSSGYVVPATAGAIFQDVGTNPADGCTTVRFFRATPGGIPDDRGYYTRCPNTPANKPVVTQHEENCGKNCTRHVTVTTIGNPDTK